MLTLLVVGGKSDASETKESEAIRKSITDPLRLSESMLLRKPLDRHQLLGLATVFEEHPDYAIAAMEMVHTRQVTHIHTLMETQHNGLRWVIVCVCCVLLLWWCVCMLCV